MFFIYQWYSYVFIMPAIVFSIYASIKVQTTFNKYSKYASNSNTTASDMTRMMVERYNLFGVKVRRTNGNLTDHYNPKDYTLNLSTSVYDSNSIAALGVAAHETGHAVQHKNNYLPLKIRSFLVPVVNFGSMLALPLIVLGVILEFILTTQTAASFAGFIVFLGIICYAGATLFALITLPVEIDASRRATKMLTEMAVLDKSEINGVKKVLSAAALTYFAAFTVSLMYLIRLLFILSKIRGNKR